METAAAEQCDQSTPQQPRQRLWPQRLLAGVFALALLAGCFFLYSRDSNFPINYHPDESGKVEQILTDRRNFRHPPLMLECTELAMQWLHTPAEPQEVVEVGRWTSAVFGAVAVTSLAIAGYAGAGLVGMLLVGLSVGLCAPLLAYSHYMKEDAALIMGIALTVLASRLVWDSRRCITRLLSLILLGMSCAVAVSGKYAGVMAFAMAILVLLLARPVRWYLLPLRPIIFLLALGKTWQAINYRSLVDQPWQKLWQALSQAQWTMQTLADTALGAIFRPEALASMNGEIEHSITQHQGLTMSRPNTFFIDAIRQETQAHILILGVLFLLLIPLLWRKRGGWKSAWDPVLVLFFAVCFLGISYSVIPFTRYILPCVVLAYFMAGLAAAGLVQRLARKRRTTVLLAGLAATALLVLQLPRFIDYMRQFHDDSRDRLAAWVAENIPPGTQIMQDDYASLGGVSYRSHRSPVRLGRVIIRSTEFLPQYQNLAAIRQSGISYVVVCDASYERYFDPHVYPVPQFRRAYDKRRQLYEEIFAKGHLVWESVPRYPIRAYTNPAIRVYRIDQ